MKLFVIRNKIILSVGFRLYFSRRCVGKALVEEQGREVVVARGRIRSKRAVGVEPAEILGIGLVGLRINA